MSDDTRADVISDVAVSLDGFAAALGDTVGAKFLEERASVLKGIALDMVQEHDPLAAVRALNEKKLQGDLEAALIETSDQPTEEPQEVETHFVAESPVAPAQFHLTKGGLVMSAFTLDRYGDYIDACQEHGLTGLPSSMASDPEANSGGGVIGSFSEVSDEAVRAAGGDPISAPIDAAIEALGDIPDFGPTES